MDAENLCKKLAQDTMLTKKDELGNDIIFLKRKNINEFGKRILKI